MNAGYLTQAKERKGAGAVDVLYKADLSLMRTALCAFGRAYGMAPISLTPWKAFDVLEGQRRLIQQILEIEDKYECGCVIKLCRRFEVAGNAYHPYCHHSWIDDDFFTIQVLARDFCDLDDIAIKLRKEKHTLYGYRTGDYLSETLKWLHTRKLDITVESLQEWDYYNFKKKRRQTRMSKYTANMLSFGLAPKSRESEWSSSDEENDDEPEVPKADDQTYETLYVTKEQDRGADEQVYKAGIVTEEHDSSTDMIAVTDGLAKCSIPERRQRSRMIIQSHYDGRNLAMDASREAASSEITQLNNDVKALAKQCEAKSIVVWTGVEESKEKAYLDTGAHHNFISLSKLRALGLENALQTDEKARVTLADESTVLTEGYVMLYYGKFKAETPTITDWNRQASRFWVARTLNHNIIVGRDETITMLIVEFLEGLPSHLGDPILEYMSRGMPRIVDGGSLNLMTGDQNEMTAKDQEEKKKRDEEAERKRKEEEKARLKKERAEKAAKRKRGA